VKRNRLIFLGSFLAIAVGVGSAVYWHLQRTFSAAVHLKADRACAYRMPCVFTIADIFPDEWDRLIVFDMAASQDEIDKTVGQHVARPDLQRSFFFMRGSKIVRIMYENQGVEHPEGDEVVFEHVPAEQNHLIIARSSVFVRTRGAAACESCTTLMLLRPGELAI
jgi:hypothetical protein